jgi:hypothetical protein
MLCSYSRFIPLIIALASCSQEPHRDTSSSAIAIRDSFQVNGGYFDKAVRTGRVLDSAAASTLGIRDLAELKASSFKYSILDTLLLRPGVISLIVAKYHDDESFAFLVNYSLAGKVSSTTVYYDNSEGCWQTESTIYANGRITKYNYDCYRDANGNRERPVEHFVIAEAGELKEMYDTSHTVSEVRTILQDIDNDTVITSLAELNAIVQTISSAKDAEITEGSAYTWGDCEGSYKRIADNKGNVLHLFKSYCGEWGFDNSQFYFRNDSLMLSRLYDYSFLYWIHDRPMFHVEEVVHKFRDGKVVIKKRERTLITGTNHNLDHLPFRDSIADYEDALFDQVNELEELLQLQEIGEEEDDNEENE